MKLNDIRKKFKENSNLRTCIYNTIIWLGSNYTEKFELLKTTLGIELLGEFSKTISFDGLAIIIIALIDEEHNKANNNLDFSYQQNKRYKSIISILKDLADNSEIDVTTKRTSHRSGTVKLMRLINLHNMEKEYLQ